LGRVVGVGRASSGRRSKRANKALVEAGMPTIGDRITNHKSAAYVR